MWNELKWYVVFIENARLMIVDWKIKGQNDILFVYSVLIYI